MWFSSSRLGPELSELFGQILHEVTTSSKFAMEDAFCKVERILPECVGGRKQAPLHSPTRL